ncbi:hypothetical protein J8273_8046 [Carpediemonas membranifera]|uniref:Uncharacterized protein n=1 Tax=Carpediemonas membranifera TaxID=201153 RepID=A0A8J6B126_9EUKA|nr:hypothetical protein J8273_8046 [Carpediemonas membranifera]|eukprot:KAG9390674.1 hypothetical protein J8273_8046 [Carpediemonas membranifera]
MSSKWCDSTMADNTRDRDLLRKIVAAIMAACFYFTPESIECMELAASEVIWAILPGQKTQARRSSRYLSRQCRSFATSEHHALTTKVNSLEKDIERLRSGGRKTMRRLPGVRSQPEPTTLEQATMTTSDVRDQDEPRPRPEDTGKTRGYDQGPQPDS